MGFRGCKALILSALVLGQAEAARQNWATVLGVQDEAPKAKASLAELAKTALGSTWNSWPFSSSLANRLSAIDQTNVQQAQALSNNAQGVLNQLHRAGSTQAAIADQTAALGSLSNSIAAQGNALNLDLSSAQNLVSANENLIASQSATLTNIRSQQSDNIQGVISNFYRNADAADAISSNAAAINANTANIANLGSTVAANQGALATQSANIASTVASQAANSGAIASLAATSIANQAAISAVGTTVSANSAVLASLVPQVNMLAGSVASNTAAIAGLNAQVATLNSVAAPTVALASTLGVPVSTVSSLALAGSFMGPALGCVMLVYICWPPKKTDPWWKMEARVAKLLDDKFKEVRRERLKKRLIRYLRSFSRCSNAWMQHAADNKERAEEAASMLQQAQHYASGQELPLSWAELSAEEGASDYQSMGTAAPPCMMQLESTMSLERDEWMASEDNSLSSLFMPFANMHTQVQQLLHDYPTKDAKYMHWEKALTATAGEYAAYMLSQLLDAWKSQMCRTVRLRYSISKVFWWQFQFSVLEQEWQPNAGQTCWDQCGEKSGWCNFCGGADRGACCKRGAAQEVPPKDPSECLQFDTPVLNSWGKEDHVCVHADCGQRGAVYTGVEVLKVRRFKEDDWTQCHTFCKGVPEAAYFMSKTVKTGGGFKCKCAKGAAAVKSYTRWDYVSGSTDCPNPDAPQTVVEKEKFQTEEEKQDMSHVPMTETQPCELSPAVKTAQELEENHPEWIKACYTNATKVVLKEFNPFYRRFAKFMDKLIGLTGCAEVDEKGLTEDEEGDDTEDFGEPGEKFDFHTFEECDWSEERMREAEAEWTPDRERSSTFGTSKLDPDDQRMLKTPFPLPRWLEHRRERLSCILEKFPASGKKAKLGAQHQIVQAIEEVASMDKTSDGQ